MEIDDIRKLVEIVNQGNLSLLEIVEGDRKITLQRASAAPVPAAVPVIQAGSPSTPSAPEAAGSDELTVDFNKIIEVRSPLVGVFYAAPAPGAEPFVSIGTQVKKGDVLCIIETMKVMNEITSDHDGEIIDICVKNAEVAEFGQVLFKMF